MANEMEIVNLTPHSVDLVNEEGEVFKSYPPSGKVLRLESADRTEIYGDDDAVLHAAGIPYKIINWDLIPSSEPEMSRNRRYIVSLPCLLAHPRWDYVVPYEEVRDGSGTIIGCRSLATSEAIWH